jgi:hypothetical protein
MIFWNVEYVNFLRITILKITILCKVDVFTSDLAGLKLLERGQLQTVPKNVTLGLKKMLYPNLKTFNNF